jgi:hypothetical protein
MSCLILNLFCSTAHNFTLRYTPMQLTGNGTGYEQIFDPESKCVVKSLIKGFINYLDNVNLNVRIFYINVPFLWGYWNMLIISLIHETRLNKISKKPFNISHTFRFMTSFNTKKILRRKLSCRSPNWNSLLFLYPQSYLLYIMNVIMKVY